MYLSWWKEMVSACPDLASFDRKAPRLTEAARFAAGISDFVASTCLKHPAMLLDLMASGDLGRVYGDDRHHRDVSGQIATMDSDASLGKILRLIRQREMIRIAIRDLSGLSDFAESTGDLSRLAEACVDGALSSLYAMMALQSGTPVNPGGEPINMVVFAMGKLGASELNFSSDIDLMFAYPEAGMTRGSENPMDALTFFTRLSQRFLKVFGSQGGDGPLFRVDLRLRPFGDNGPLILSFSALEDYYVSQGREWERYALIKARTIAGDREKGRDFLRYISPFVYRRYLDYGVFDALRDMKGMIESEVRRKGLDANVKLGSGGIREIEFFAQVFQLIRGGIEPELRQRGLFQVLDALERHGLISAQTREDLTGAYVFLRLTENRIQAMEDLQTHDLPTDGHARIKLATAMGYPSWEGFVRDLSLHRSRVRIHFTSLLGPDGTKEHTTLETDLEGVWKGRFEAGHAADILSGAGFRDTETCLRLLRMLKNDPGTRALSTTGLKRLDRLLPLLLAETGQAKEPDTALARLLDLVRTIERRTSYISLLIENKPILKNLVLLASESSWLVSHLSAHPLLLDELINIRQLSSPLNKKALSERLDRQMAQTDTGDQEQVMEKLTVFKLTQALKVAVAEVTELYPLMTVSDSLCALAETLLEKVTALSWAYLTEKHGFPPGHGRKDRAGGFAVVGYGKLGGLELGYGSDLDLVFLYGSGSGRTDGKNPTETSHFYSRMGQRILHLLSTHTRAGKMYDIDMRLRPSGSSGPIVSSMDAFHDYLTNQAWTFELQALVRARAVCGDPDLITRFEALRQDVLGADRDRERMKTDIRDMRDRLARERAGKSQGFFHVKWDEGGIVDIEFLVQYLVLAYGGKHRPVLRYSDNIRQLENLAGCGVITEACKAFLVETYLAYRKEVHRLDLQEKPSLAPESLFGKQRAGVRDVWACFFNET